MNTRPLIVLLISGLISVCTSCKEVYTPPVTKTNTNILVIDGIVVSGNDSSVISISRTRPLPDTIPSVKELGARVSVVDQNGVEYLFDEWGNGRYGVFQL